MVLKNIDSSSSKQTIEEIGKILIPVDGSENSKRAARIAIAIAKTNQSQLIVLTASAMPSMFPAYPVVEDQYFDEEERQGKRLVEEIVSLARQDGVDARGEVKRADKSVVEVILQTAAEEKVGLIIIGTRGLGGFKKLLTGSVSNAIVAHAHCNVMVVK